MHDHWIYKRLLSYHISADSAELLTLLFNTALVILILIAATLIIRKILLTWSLRWIKTNRYRWDDALLDNHVIGKLSWFIPVLIAHLLIDALLPPQSSIYIISKRIIQVFFVIISVISINALLSTAADIYRALGTKRAEVLQGFIDAGKIVSYIIGTIFIVSIFSGMSPWGIISVLGGMTAVTMLVFRDTIVGFVASIQLTTTDMVRIGDWVEMPSYGADGDVISMSIHTIRIQNWDKTITTIPTYALVSNSFKNWRGMSESGGRRIKRALTIDVNSIRFCDQELLERFSRIGLLKDYLRAKSEEIRAYNREHAADVENELLINGRRQTNIGVFRAYLIAYLKNNEQINQHMTFLVRQLPPSAQGLPLEIYVFSRDKRWASYEDIQADIFDHLFAALPIFDLRAFQNPTGHDLRVLSDAALRCESGDDDAGTR
jgi:miniconductance mechanosensitive channel